MCGICGYVSKNLYSNELLMTMNESIRYRGPDDTGVVMEKLGSGYIGLGHSRLSILDLSPKGHQPMYSKDGSCVIVYNGEIYNFRELRTELQKSGLTFESNCDTEVLLAAYQAYGIDFLNKLNGMFAFALLDKNKETILLARDRVGIKPLYYYYTGENFIWGSELKPIMCHPQFKKEIRKDVIAQFLCYKYIISPNTIFHDTYKVEPGQYILWQNGKLSKKTYWNIYEKYNQLSSNKIEAYEQAKMELKDLLYDSTKKRMIADVPVGTFLSGGIDSTVITAIAQNISNTPIHTYTIGFETKQENEAEYAKAIARYLGTDHTELYVSDTEVQRMCENIENYFDEPFSDSSQIPTMLVSELAKRDIKVALAGDGGDELFCGYKMYDWAQWAQRLDRAGYFLYYLIGNSKYIEKLPDKVYALINNRDDAYKAQIFTDVRQRYMPSLLLCEGSAKFDLERQINEDNLQIKRMLLDMKSYLPDEILSKTDRASMKYSLEARVPLVDYRVIEYSFRIPHEFKYKKHEKKYILKDIAYDYVPKKLLDRPKQGFGVPLALWMRTTLNKELKMFADKEKLRKQGIFNSEGIWLFIDKLEQSNKSVYNSVLWSFFVFQRWYRKYIEDLWS